MKKLITLVLVMSINYVHPQSFLPKWEKGCLDIHHISTRSGNSSLIILPDGTTILVDAGDLNRKTFEQKYFPLKVSPSLKDTTITTGRIIYNYLQHVYGKPVHTVDYFILTHYHSDHYGEISQSSPMSPTKQYLQTGITELGDLIDIKRFVVRDYPHNVKNLLRNTETEKNLANLLRYIEYQREAKGMKLILAKAGSLNQIKTHHGEVSNFSIRNIKVGDFIWNGKGEHTISLFPYKGFYQVEKYENSLSMAFLIKYGDFKYYFGGDNTGLEDQDHPSWFDCETPMSKVIDSVNVMVTNHHGNRDATNRNFIESLNPEVVVMPTWCSDQPGAEVGMRLISPNIGTKKRHIFMTYYQPETSVGIGPWFEKKVTSLQGHIAIRVYPNGNYKVYVIDDTTLELKVLSVHSFKSLP